MVPARTLKMDQKVEHAPYDVEAIRRDFPILSRTVYGKPLVYLDNGASASLGAGPLLRRGRRPAHLRFAVLMPVSEAQAQNGPEPHALPHNQNAPDRPRQIATPANSQTTNEGAAAAIRCRIFLQ